MTNVTSGSLFPDHFSAVAEAYARHRPVYPAELFAWLAGLPRRRRRAWDCGTGSGQAAVALAERFAQVVASDASPAQLARARRHPRVRYRAATGEAPALPDAAVDLVTVAQAVHWFDPARFWPEVRRVLAAGGAVAVWTYDVARVDPEVDAVVERYYRLLEPYWPPERALVEGAYRDLPFPFEEVAAPAFDMRAAWDLPRFAGYLATWSAARRWSVAHGGPAALDGMAGDLAAAWGAPERRRTVTWPLTVRAGRP
jgi:SAM-dependent methyltransferase